MLPGVVFAQELTVVEVSLRALASRTELTALADSIERALARSGIPDKRRRAMSADLERQRQRLAIGDILPGDRILLRYVTETARQDTVVVSPESMLALSGMPPIRMGGLLWSEVESHLRDQVSPLVLNARVSAVPLVSIGVLGSVTRPGYFLVPITASIAESIMAAGGPTADADPNGIAMKHGGRDRWNRATMIAASQNQLSLASLGATNGDAFIVNKASPPFDRGFLIGVVGLLLQGVLIATALPD